MGEDPRYTAPQCIITEKLDGTNGLVHITDDGKMFVGSRNRWIYPGKKTDNYGFAGWCEANAVELQKLGPGWHYGEWWGHGIGRNYGLEERRFSLFHTRRWGAHNPNTPACVSVVPVLYEGPYEGLAALMQLEKLKVRGSLAAPGFMNVEGVIIYLVQSDQRFKLLAENHDLHKWQVPEAT